MSAREQPRYTSRNQFANMVELRRKKLGELATRIRDHGALEDAAECIGDAMDDLERAVEKLREYVK
jgi:hypothetical protein